MHSTVEPPSNSAVVPAPTAIPVEEVEVAAYFSRKERLLRPIGALLFACSLPMLLPLMLLVKLTSSGPALYRQQRLGKHGREFRLYKLRTMYDGAESVTGPTWCQPNDTRITPFGKLLRNLHLDELPQLLNVARGEMDLVGPRPERPEIVEDLVSEVPGYAERSRVLPGITGLAQINLPPDTTYDSVRRKLILDREYIRTASLGLDLRMILCTGLRMFGIRNGRAVRWMGLERKVTATALDLVIAAASENGRAGQTSGGMPWEAAKGHGNGSPRAHAAQTSVGGRAAASAPAEGLPSPSVAASREDLLGFPRSHKPK